MFLFSHIYPVISYEKLGYRHYVYPWQMSGVCPYCGLPLDFTNATVDHIPSKALLNKPFPKDMATIPCCLRCNRGFSSDEEYFSVLLECVKHQSFDRQKLNREAVINTIAHSPALLETVKQNVVYVTPSHFSIAPDDYRVKSVLLKLIKAHLYFEGSQLLIEDNRISLSYSTFEEMTESDCSSFIEPFDSGLFPEVGSRSLNNVLLFEDEAGEMIKCVSPWIQYQLGTYYYCVSPANDRVKIFLQNFLCVSAEVFI